MASLRSLDCIILQITIYENLKLSKDAEKLNSTFGRGYILFKVCKLK